MESRSESQSESPGKSRRVNGRPFPPGNNANPRGRGTRNDRIAAAVAQLVAEFCERHRRKPSASEIGDIGIAAMLRDRISHPAVNRKLDDEAVVRLSNSYDRCMRRLGLGQAPPREASATDTDVPWPMVGERK
jgi:hypothetical protein